MIKSSGLVLCSYLTGYVKMGLRCTIINIEKSHFEMLNTVYLKNAWCLVQYAIFHPSIVIPRVHNIKEEGECRTCTGFIKHTA